MQRTRTRSVLNVCLALLAMLIALSGAAAAAPTIHLVSLQPSPQTLGASVTWVATVQNGQQGHTYDFQFSIALGGQNQIMRDFDTPNTFVWVPWKVEGTYTATVVARDITQRPYIVFPPVTQNYRILPLVTTPGQSAVNITRHPLVALFSAGPCTIGHSIRVRFRQTGAQASSTTNSVPCSSSSANFLVAGMLPSTQYQMHWEEFASNFQNSGPDLAFTTGPLPSNFPINERFRVNVPPTQHDAAFPVVIWHLIPTVGELFTYWPAATDLSGNVIWYHPGQTLIMRFQPGGTYFTMSARDLVEKDLVGNVLRQTNVNILNEQLAAHGHPTMTGLNSHETRILPNGNLLLMGSYDQTSTQYQGGTPDHPVDILGDTIMVLDHNMQLVWFWDSFAQQDLSREATLHDLCYHLVAGCPPFNQNFTTANDWTHANSVQLTSDGNLLLSERSQDWVLKINYANGTGDGHVIWKMGPYGDFTILNPPPNPCGDPNVYPWFSHQHDAAFQSHLAATDVMSIYDDGNTRHQQCGSGNSRGMVLSVSERNRTVYYQTLADLGHYSVAVGSAQLLSSPGNPVYSSWGDGLLFLPDKAALSTETDTNGHIVYELQAADWSYRTYRAQDLYTPTLP